MASDPVQRVLDLYPRIYFACHTRHVRDPATGRALSTHQVSILDHLDEVEPLTLNALAEHLGVTAGTMSVHVDRLARRGYVLRKRDPRDGRRAQLRLSASGRRVREARSVLDPGLVKRMLDELSDVERGQALRGLALLAGAADAASRAEAAAGEKHR